MELRHYWSIVAGRWWIVLLLAALVAVASVALQPQTRETWASTARVEALPPLDLQRNGYAPNQERYYGSLNMELFWDDFIPVLRDGAFAENVRQLVTPTAGGRSLAGSFDAKKEHQSLAITVTADSPEVAQMLADGAARLLSQSSGPYANGFTDKRITVQVLHLGSRAAPASRVGGTANLGLRVLLGIIAGVALAFLLEYLDDTVRSAREVADSMGLPVLGEIPLTRAR